MTTDLTRQAPRLTSLSPGAGCACKLPHGLLLAVSPDQASTLASVLRAQGLPAALIGEVVAGQSGRIEVSHGPFRMS